MPISLQNNIVKLTNQEAEKIYTMKNKQSTWKSCDKVEISEFIGLLI